MIHPIPSASQIQAWDAYTIAHEPIPSIELMERASNAFTEELLYHIPDDAPVYIFAGTGNNGGDGLAVARLLHQSSQRKIHLYIARIGKPTEDFLHNEFRLPIKPNDLTQEGSFPEIPDNAWVIDALFGSGLSRPVEGWLAQLITHINKSKAVTVSVDIASGLYCDQSSLGNIVVEPAYTFTFESPKLAMMLPENTKYIGEWKALSIGLLPEGLAKASIKHYYTSSLRAKSILHPRDKFSHKGTFGHALLMAGSYGKMGAAYMSAKAMLRSGAGLVSVHLPECGYQMMQISLPEAMCSIDPARQIISQVPDVSQYAAIGVGPGIGQAVDTRQALLQLLKTCKKHRKPLLIDADAINIIGASPEFLDQLPLHCIFTPHPKEFERLVGYSSNDFERLEQLREFCMKHQAIIVLKGAHTVVGLPNGELHFNSTGNPGMATAGSGDVLAGIITSFLAQGYPPSHAAILGVYLHGLAGDIASQRLSQPAMIASDIIEHLGKAFLEIAEK